MAESIVDLVTGQRTPYTPPQPQQPDDFGIDPSQLQGQSVDEQRKAIDAQIQFQGLRGYQQALKEGMPINQALARYMPMMLYRKNPQALASAIRSLTPPAPKPPRIEHIGSGAYSTEIDPATGQLKVLVPKEQKPSAYQMAQADVLKDALKKSRAAYTAVTGDSPDKTAERLRITNIIQKQQKALQNVFATPTAPVATPTTAATTPPPPPAIAFPKSLAEANAMSRFGQSGPRQPFVFIGGPGGNRAIPPSAGPGVVASAAPTSKKVERANQLAKENPDWTKEKILQAVNDEFK